MIINAKENLERFLQIINNQDFLACKIKCEYLASVRSDISNFYTLNNCAFMVMGQNLTLGGDVCDADIVQILSFCQFCGISAIESQIINIPVKNIHRLQLMEYRSKGEGTNDVVVKNNDIYSFAKFSCENFEDLYFDMVYANMAKKVNYNLANIYYQKDENGKIATGLVASNYSNNNLYLTFVSTQKNHRNKHLASGLIHYVAQKNTQGKTLLVCENNLVDFYKKIGFAPIDTIVFNTLKDDKI